MKSHFIHLTETHSTSLWMQNYARKNDPDEGLLVYANYQTNGRGQIGNHWESEPNKNLLFTLLLRPKNLHANNQFILSQAIALGVHDFLSNFDQNFTIKWPNDIYWKDQKVAGILIENDLSGSNINRSYIGIGLNINQMQFDSDAPNPISLAQIMGKKFDLDLCLLQVYESIIKRYFQIDHTSEIKTEYTKVLYRYQSFAKYRDSQGNFIGKIEDVENTGHLIVRHQDNGLHRYFFKEITFLIDPTSSL